MENAGGAGLERARDELSRSARDLLRRLELPDRVDDQDVVEAALPAAIQRFEKRSATSFSGAPWHGWVVRREFLKVLAGRVFQNEVRLAIAAADSGKKLEIGRNAFEAIAPAPRPGESAGSGRYIDPEQWDLEAVAASTDEDRYLRLSLLTSGMLVQEETLAEGGVSIREAAERA